MFPEDALSNHTDMMDNEPVINEAKRNFMRYSNTHYCISVQGFSTFVSWYLKHQNDQISYIMNL